MDIEQGIGQPVEQDGSVGIAEPASDDTGLSTSDIKRNMVYIIMLDAIFTTGAADLMLALQPLLVFLKASNTMIGLVTGANWAGLLGVFLSPWITRRFRYKKWYMFFVHIPYIAAIGVSGLGVLYSKRLGMDNPELLQFMLIIFLAHWFFAGFVSLPHQEYVAACIPMKYRGRYTGFSFSIGGILSIAASALGGIILLRAEKPLGFGYVLLLSWAIMQFGYIFALFAKERPTPVEHSPIPWSANMLKAAWNDKPFMRFLFFNMLIGVLIMPVYQFVAIYGFKTLHMIPATAAVMQVVGQATRIIASSPLGWLTDRFTPKRMLPYWMLMAFISLLPVILLRNQYGVYICGGLATVFGVGWISSFNALMYGLPKPEDRAGHFTLLLITIYITASAGAILFGVLSDMMPFRTVFMLCAALALALFPMARWVANSLSADEKSYS